MARPSSVFASSPTFDFPDGGDFPASPFSSFSSNKDPYRESGGFGFGGGDRDRDSGGSTYFGKREVNTEPRKVRCYGCAVLRKRCYSLGYLADLLLLVRLLFEENDNSIVRIGADYVFRWLLCRSAFSAFLLLFFP